MATLSYLAGLACAACALLWLLEPADGARILVVLPLLSYSHFQVARPLLDALSARGHDVVLVSRFPHGGSANYTDIAVTRASHLKGTIPFSMIETIAGPVTNSLLVMYAGLADCEDVLGEPQVQQMVLPDSGQHFDLLILELFHSDCFLALAHRFRAPVVGLSTSAVVPWGSARLGNPDNPAHVPNLFLGATDDMSLLERLHNAAVLAAQRVAKAWYFDMRDQQVAERLVGTHLGADRPLPRLTDIARNTSLLLVNTFHALSLPRPLATNVIEVGGIHMAEPGRLPEDLEQFVGGAKDGVVVFSLGSMIRTSSLPREQGAALLQALGTLKQRVLWKWEDEAPGPVPKNVRLLKWLPQFDTLCHNNTRLFIGHGGLLSTSEAAHCGVPLLGIAMYGDQRLNLAAIAKTGAGRGVPYNTLKNADLFIKNVREMLEDPSYRESAKVLSTRYRDRPMSPLETAVYWTEYVIRHKGAPHLRGAARNLAWWQEALLDVIAVVAVGLAALLYVLWGMLRALARLVRSLGGSCDNKQAAAKKKKKA